ncbi:HlyD family efflux transporter periplasmic adaptor subunit [Aquaspirillum sp. LM1]|uniref:HlyD family efflux transporter periplasmic adaptor subunit n=1 Tax=Aquaspirillum sp. LM1 TaxID=1938604 RepID=UPI0009859B0F|nr:HlyD family efflux transporter periplasmic adaptor subunit [Aquaspirillum sp. LM1]
MHQIPTRTDQELADIDRDFGVLAQETAELQTRDRYAITAPLDSIVTSITAQVGQPINGQALAILLPVDAQLEANLYLPSRAIGFIEIGQKVRLRYQAYPYQKFGQYDGIVKEIARSPIPVNELPMASPLISQEVVYRVTVKLAAQYILAYGKQIMLRPGMALEADIEQERRRLIEWILEPLYGFHKYFP